MSFPSSRLSHVEAFAGLSADDLALLESRLLPLGIGRGETLVCEGDDADALYVVVSGRFAVELAGNATAVAEIGAGAPIGEIGFFAGGQRTATVRAIRDSVVVRLNRTDFDEISAYSPSLTQVITAALARRLARETRRNASLPQVSAARPRPRTIAVIAGGPNPIDPSFIEAFSAHSGRGASTLVVSSASVCEHIATPDLASLAATRALNELERRYETLVFIPAADDAFADRALHQADEVLIACTSDDSPVAQTVGLNALEQKAFALHPAHARRVVIVHPRRHALQGTRHWLAARDCIQHHHVALGNDRDLQRLWRFLRGEALGFVACGGGAYCSAHIGIYRAFKDSGIDFDYFGGTSGGSAMAAAFAQDLPADEIEAGVQRMFIDGKALARYTLPRYSVLDHKHFDRHLKGEYGETRIEDLWKPYFAVSTDLSDYETEVHRSGPVWEAIRASAAIPALLPPFYTADGRMLVDGSVVANVPIDIMHQLKNGPNVVVNFSPPSGERFGVAYASLPERRELLISSLHPFRRQALPDAPSAGTVLVRSLMANRAHFERQIGADDWLLTPPTPADMGALDWRRHRELAETAYHYAVDEIARRRSSGKL